MSRAVWEVCTNVPRYSKRDRLFRTLLARDMELVRRMQHKEEARCVSSLPSRVGCGLRSEPRQANEVRPHAVLLSRKAHTQTRRRHTTSTHSRPRCLMCTCFVAAQETTPQQHRDIAMRVCSRVCFSAPPPPASIHPLILSSSLSLTPMS